MKKLTQVPVQPVNQCGGRAALPLRVAVVGCGRMGRLRAQEAGGQVVALCDLEPSRAAALQAEFSPAARVYGDWQQCLADAAIDAVFVCTSHEWLAEVGAEAARQGKHVFLEKPGARNPAELLRVARAVTRSGVKLRIGYSLRSKQSIHKAYEIWQSGAIGEVMFVRGRYGHGGRLGYEKEWRADPECAGGGELIDQGVHLIDLARLFLGDFEEVRGTLTTSYWDMAVEDNAFLTLRTARQQVAQLHASWTEWKNQFHFEVMGRYGKLDLQGLGGSYGREILTHYQMRAEMGPPETTRYEFAGSEICWAQDWARFQEDVAEDRDCRDAIADALAALQVVEEVYEQTGRRAVPASMPRIVNY